MDIKKKDVEIETIETFKIASDTALLAQVDNDADRFFDLMPYSTSFVNMTMPTKEEGGIVEDYAEGDLRTIRCHIEERIGGVLGVIKANNVLRLIVLHEDYGIVLIVEAMLTATGLAARRMPPTYRVVGAEAMVEVLGSKVDALE
jgi:hypothetical protein